MNIKIAKVQANKLTYLLFYSIAAIILFSPVLNKNFVSDDYVVLKRVCLDKTIRIQGFFRPLSDVTIYINYLFGGFNPFVFNLFNILLHSLNSYLLFQFCLKWKWSVSEEVQHNYAFIASILFLTYPFHNEAIVWMLGRGASLAGVFGITALLIFSSGGNSKTVLPGVCACYFVGLLAYESIIVLPVPIFILLTKKETALRTYLIWAVAFLITGIAHFLFRYKFSGAVFGTYGEDMLKTPWLHYPGNMLKVMSRLIIPPVSNSRLFVLLSIIAALIMIIVLSIIFVKKKNSAIDKVFVLKLLTILGGTLVVPILFAVSTRTSESDRLLYFPSFFVCCFISFLICRYLQSKFQRQLIFLLFGMYNILFLELNNFNWFKAGSATYSILQLLKSDTGSRKKNIVNLPNEIKGAYIFREGFSQALIINKVDTSTVVVINKLSKELVTNPDETWIPVVYKTKIFIPPFVEVSGKVVADTNRIRSQTIHYRLPSNNRLYYWNQHQFVLLKEPPGFW